MESDHRVKAGKGPMAGAFCAGALAASIGWIVFGAFGGDIGGKKAEEQARAQVNKWADRLDQQTDEIGSYIRYEKQHLEETDPWGTPLKVSYSAGGVAENVVVRSAGKDREFDTDDDQTATRMAMNFKGTGQGIKQNAAEVTGEAARGAVKGTVEGIKDTVRDVFSKKPTSEDVNDNENDPNASSDDDQL